MSFSMGGRDLSPSLALVSESSRRFPLSLRTELAKYRHVPCNLRHLEFELNSVELRDDRGQKSLPPPVEEGTG
jgi:hypothetical protein